MDYARAFQSLCRVIVGEYKVFHILTYNGGAASDEYGEGGEFAVQETRSPEGPGFRIMSAMHDGLTACECSMWTASASNRIRNFIPLKEGEAELVLLETHVDYRRRGLAKRLVIIASNRMLDRGFAAIYARVWHSNKASLNTFARARWRYAYTMVEICPVGRTCRFCVRVPYRK